MPLGSARAAVTSVKGFSFFISVASSNANLRTLANSAGYTGGNCTVTINSGVDLYSTSAGTAAVVPGSWPSGAVVTLIVKGTISGTGGAGGNGGSGAGGAGGTALDASTVSGFTFKVDNQSVLQGGGGGGGGGVTQSGGSCCVSITAGGGGGGGGQGHNGGSGAGGAGSSSSQPANFPTVDGAGGGSGSTGAAGAGGGGGTVFDGCGRTILIGGAGGAGGGWGASGTAGVSGGGGGAGGKSVVGNSNITWINTGTRSGAVT